jgi:hypothetical protein
LVILAATPSSKQIFNESSLFYMAIKIETFKSNNRAKGSVNLTCTTAMYPNSSNAPEAT